MSENQQKLYYFYWGELLLKILLGSTLKAD